MRLSYSQWMTLVERHLDRMDETSVLFTDEQMNAEAAYDNGDLPLLYAKRVASDRDYREAKLSGDLWR